MPKLNEYGLDSIGVDVTTSPIHLKSGALREAKNTVFSPAGGVGGLKKRGSLDKVNAAAMNSGASVLGAVNLPFPNPGAFVDTLYVGLGSLDSDTWASTTDGTTWAEVTTPAQVLQSAKMGVAQFVNNRALSFDGKLYYPGNDFVRYPTASFTAPPLRVYDGTTDLELLRIPPNPTTTAGAESWNILDIVAHGGSIYLSVWDEGGTAPDHKGRVFRLNPRTGVLTQIGNSFGDGTGEATGGMPWRLQSFMGRLWAGTYGVAGSAVGKVYHILPDVEQTWTLDLTTATGAGYIMSMAVYEGQLYIGTMGDAGSAALVRRRTTAGVWATSDTGSGTTANNQYGELISFNGDLYAVYHEPAAATHVRKYDGTSWSTDLDVDAAESDTYPGQGIVWNSNLYLTFNNILVGGDSDATGFIYQRTTGGTWTKRFGDANVRGYIGNTIVRT